MLNITRRHRESVVITAPDGTEIDILICNVDGGTVRLGIAAPQPWTIDRYEIYDRKKRNAEGLPRREGPEPRMRPVQGR